MSIGNDILAGWLVESVDGVHVNLPAGIVSVKTTAHLGIDPDSSQALTVTMKSEDWADMFMAVFEQIRDQLP